jgi:CRP/FNR family transcriptional regulator, cyclic AMP receptor protein
MPSLASRDLASFFKEVPIFNGLEGRSLRSVLSTLKEESFPAGSEVFRVGEMGRKMYLLAEGEVQVLWKSSNGKLRPMFRLGPGECFGEMSLIELQPRSATVRVTKPARMYSFTNLDLYRLFHRDNYSYVIVLQNICRILSRRLRVADNRLCDFLQVPKGKSPRRARKRPQP